MKNCHQNVWREWCFDFVRLFNEGYSLKQIMKQYNTLFSWTVIAQEILRTAEENKIRLAPLVSKVNPWEPATFKKESTTLWQFPKRGDWFVHNGTYRGNWPPQVPRNLILQYSSKDDVVLDCFLGGGTTGVESLLLQRKGIGLDVSPHSISMSKEIARQIKSEADKDQKNIEEYFPSTVLGDARRLPFRDNSIDLVCCQPPYADAISYTWNVKGDLSKVRDIDEFCHELGQVALELHRVLKPEKRCTIMIGDIRRNRMMIPLGFKVLKVFLDTNFKTEEIVIKKQFQDRSTPFYKSEGNALLNYRIEHEYVFVLRKIVTEREDVARSGFRD
ncbi:MAG: TRM11 family methyltransferase [Candidatus Bathyarchaeia archaeon]